MLLRDFCVSTTGTETTSKKKKTTQHCRGAVGTSTRAVTCALTSKPQLLLIFHSAGAVVSTVKNNQICYFSSVTVSSIVAQLDEQPVRVGVLQLRAVELFHALGGQLVAQAHAVEDPSHPPLAGTHVESLCFEPCCTPCL